MQKQVGLNLMVIFAVIIAFTACAARTPVEPTPTPTSIPTSENPEALKKISVVLREFKVGSGVENGEIPMAQSKITTKNYLQSKDLFKIIGEDKGETYESPVMIIDVQPLDHQNANF